ncbi:hypothetical protein LJC19_03355 [Oxalobacter sp. OttesenSCG-928-P03]|nr:hypothetical protein [Oxalobacter sp. OttesenSCG-928-P03]
MDNDIHNFEGELQDLLQSGEAVVLIEMNPGFLEKLMQARPSVMLDLTSDHNEYQGIKVFLSEDAEDYQFHLAIDDDGFEWIQEAPGSETGSAAS